MITSALVTLYAITVAFLLRYARSKQFGKVLDFYDVRTTFNVVSLVPVVNALVFVSYLIIGE